MTDKLQTLAVVLPLADPALDLLRSSFATVHYYPDGDIPVDIQREVEVWYTKWMGLPKGIEFADLGKTRVIQLTSAGANLAIKHPALASPEARAQIAVCSASGIHAISIPPYIVAMVVNLYYNIQASVVITKTEHRWPRRPELGYRASHAPPTPAASPVFGSGGFKTVRGRTAGLLGYGHIGRETARLLKAMGVRIIAANSSGEKRADDGYIIPGTGDADGSLPEAYFSTSDAVSFNEFLSQSDILIASLPSTPATTYMLKEEHFAALPKDAIFINVGRGDLVQSDIVLAALDKPDGLLAVALDVTDPEPLPDNHLLFSHPRALITPHISADVQGYFSHGAELLVANVERIRAGGKPMNVVDPARGY